LRPETNCADYREPHGDWIRKELNKLDVHARAFLSRSPFVLIGTQDENTNGDVSPRGDRPGFVQALDDGALVIPDRPGNNRMDSFENILRNPAVGLIFVIPGVNETLRINGLGKLTADPGLFARLAVNGKPAVAVLVFTIRAVFMNCAKSFIRSRLWSPESWPARAEMPTLGQILRDQLALRKDSAKLDEFC
jgi:PPOX class probable FMN-dependent enzyme